MPGEGARFERWHRALPNSFGWGAVLAIISACAIVGGLLVLNPQYENPRNPFLGLTLVVTAVAASLLMAWVSLLDLVAIQYSPVGVDIRLRSGRIIHARWQDVDDCKYYPENKAFSIAFVGRRFAWRTRVEQEVGNDLVRLLASNRRR